MNFRRPSTPHGVRGSSAARPTPLTCAGQPQASGRYSDHAQTRPVHLADRVEHQVGLADRVLEAVGVQRDEPVGAQLHGQLPGMAAPGANHLGADPAGQLDRRRSDRAAVPSRHWSVSPNTSSPTAIPAVPNPSAATTPDTSAPGMIKVPLVTGP